MAADLAEFLWNKTSIALQEAEAELPITSIALLSLLGEIKAVIKNEDGKRRLKKIQSSTVLEICRLLDDLTDKLAECRTFWQQMNALKRNWLGLNFVREFYFVYKWKTRLTPLKDTLKDKVSRMVQEPELDPTNNEVLPMRRRTICGESASEIFGFDEFKKNIERKLFEDDGAAFKAIGIFGMGGTGKTTLVREVFNSERVAEEFPLRVWVCLSDIKNMKIDEIEAALVKCVLQASAIDSSIFTTSSNTTFVDLLKFLNGQPKMKYLIVLDNAWHVPKFCENLRERTQTGIGKGSTSSFHGAVIVTSRLKEVARKAVGERYLLRLPPLSNENDCWNIFEHALPKDSKEIPPKFKNEIEYQCHGLPLAAKTLAKIVSAKRSEEFEELFPSQPHTNT